MQTRIFLIALSISIPLSALALPGCSSGSGGSGGGSGDGGVDGGGECAAGTQDEDGDGTCLPDCSGLACNDGACVITSGVASCECAEGFAGDACDALDAPAATSVAFWVDAADSSTVTASEAGLLTGWTDKGEDHLASLVDADDAAKPSLVPDALNGLPVVRFEGDYVQWDGFAGLTNESSYTVFMVVSSGLEDGVFLSATGTDDLFEVSTGAGNQSVELTHEPGAGQSYLASGFGWSAPSAHIVTLQHTTSRISIWIDGRSRFDGPTANTAALGGDVDVLVGKGEAGELQGDVAEVLIMNSALDYAARRGIEAYLGAKWFGKAPEVDPTSIVAASLWLDASDADSITAVDGSVTDWENLGYAGGHLAQGAFPDARPARVASALNGHAVVRFDGGDYVGLNAFGWPGGNAYSLFAVLAPEAEGGALTAFAALSGGDPGLRLNVLPDAALVELTHRWPAAPSGGDVASAGLEAVVPMLVEARRSGPAMSVTATGNTASVTGTEGDIDAATLDLVVGAETVSSPATGFAGDIAELILVNGVLSNDEQAALAEWLTAKWGL